MKKSLVLSLCVSLLVQALCAGEGLTVTASSTEKKIHMHHNIELDESPYPQYAADGVLGTKWSSKPGDNHRFQALFQGNVLFMRVY